MEGGMKIARFSTNVLLYFENDTRYGRSYNGRRIETRVRYDAISNILSDPLPRFQGDANIRC